jgi:hypothetical protein
VRAVPTTLVALLIAAATASPAIAQQSAFETAGVSSANAASHPVLTTIASALVPGTGQAIMRQKRSALYLALEAAGLGFYVSQNRDGKRQRDRYREISRTVARGQLSPDGPQGNWDYFERMEKYIASGAYDAIPGGDIDPETNPEFYNGAMWLLARQTYWRDPEIPPARSSAEYAQAVSFYAKRAVPADLQWSWIGAQDDFKRYRSAIAGSNAAFRNAEQTASLVIANHFLSAVDAYVSVRMRIRRDLDGTRTLAASIPF